MIQASQCFTAILKSNHEILNNLSREINIELIKLKIKNKFNVTTIQKEEKNNMLLKEISNPKLEKNILFHFYSSIQETMENDLSRLLPLLNFFNEICAPELESSEINVNILHTILFANIDQQFTNFFIPSKM